MMDSESWLGRLPWILSLVPWCVWGLGRLIDANVLDVIFGILFIPFILLYDALGIIRWHVLGGGGHWSHDLIYVQSSSVVLFVLSRLVLKWFV